MRASTPLAPRRVCPAHAAKLHAPVDTRCRLAKPHAFCLRPQKLEFADRTLGSEIMGIGKDSPRPDADRAAGRHGLSAAGHRPGVLAAEMSSPGRAFAPRQRSGWPTRRAPLLAYVVTAGVIAGMVLVALVHRPGTAERAADLRSFISDMRADIGSCAADVGASMTALRAIETGTSHDVATAENIATSGAGDCSPANDELIDDLIQYQVTESLASFRLGRAVNGLVTWAAPDAVRVQLDIANVLTARSAPARADAEAALRRDLGALDAQRAAVDSVIGSASRSLAAHVTPLPLPG